MSNEKEDLKNQLQSIKDNIEKKLSEVETSSEKPLIKKNDSKNHKPKKKKSISINVGMEVVSVVENKTIDKDEIQKKSSLKNQENKPKVSTKKTETLPKIKEEKRKKKKKLPILQLILVVILLSSLAYVYSLKKGLKDEENKFEKEKIEAIDYSEDVYFKDVDDEVDDEEMQDFAVYKDVPDIVADNNLNSKVLSASDEKSINQQISQRRNNQKNNSQTTSVNVSKDANKTSLSATENANDDANKPAKEALATQPKSTSNDKAKSHAVYTDLIKVIGLEHKEGRFTLPKKVKRTNAFKVRIRLNKNQINSSDKDNEIMLVIKDNTGKTIKIDSKKVNFKKRKSKVLNLELYEIFPERLKTNANYSFSVFADRKLIKSYQKSI